MPANTLSDMARRACMKNIRAIKDLGGLPYDVVRPILVKVENPEQLDKIEQASPQLRGHDNELWIEFYKRDIPGWETKDYIPEDNFGWYKTYKSLLAESQREIEDDAALLKSTLTGIKNERANHQSKHVHPDTVPKLPKMGGMKYVRTPRKKKAPAPLPSSLSFRISSRNKGLTGKGVVQLSRKEARQKASLISKHSIIATPTHELSNYATQITTAPRSLIYDYQKKAVSPPLDPTVKPKPTFASNRKRVDSTAPLAPTPMSLEERERRLRALTNSIPAKSTTYATIAPSPKPPTSTKPKTYVTIAPSPVPLAPQTPTTSLKPAARDATSSTRTFKKPTTYVTIAPSPTLSWASSNPQLAIPHLDPTPRAPILIKPQPNAAGSRPVKRARAPINPFMPIKKRKIS